MRLLASLPDQDQATRFGDYLITVDIDNSVEEGASGWSVWVKDDDKVEAAKRELAQFVVNPHDSRYTAAGRKAEKVRQEQENRAKRLQKNYVDVRTQWSQPGGLKPLTIALIALCCLVGIVTVVGKRHESLAGLRISPRNVEPVITQIGPMMGWHWRLTDLTEIRQGQVWRLITPVLIHYGALHLIFNMWLLRDFGTIIERQKGAWWLAILIVVIGIPSNLAQYIMAGPWFGGMSGVVYGLFGYIWMKGKFSPQEGLELHPNTIFFLVGWFLLCFTGWVGHVANTAHAVGLLIGMAFGIAGYLRRKLIA
ncbi:MAG TPA: rhomboid family intramembrane serine protease [Tepidisphaeraceae bacterium]|jgi:GlpG protein|nr:rhomboid family intramembrane serine protease [Tepidisphaeraceae bacterium]